jgi:prolyl oligopeptidase
LTNDDHIWWFITTLDAPMKRICKYDLTKPHEGFTDVIPESEDPINTAFVINQDKLVVSRLHNVKDVVKVYNLYTGEELYDLPLPMGSIISQITGERKDQVAFYSFSSFLSPGTNYTFDFTSNQHQLFRETTVHGLQAHELETHQVFYNSKDGTKIPMYVIHKKGLKRDSMNPTILYGYGGFNISLKPFFSVNAIAWVQHFNGVFCVANIRGGSEYGQEKWYNQGRLDKKQNVFDDFQYAAKYLISEGYTKPEKLAINGGSNGGLLVGACINQAPELFGCAVAEVGVMDILRFHKFTIGAAWVSDYGNPDKKEDFEVALKYSPLHNVKNQQYPSVLIMTGDHDDRVVPLHSLKFLATLQHTAADNVRPLLGRIDTKAGHGAGKPTKQRIEEAADKYCFIALELGATWTE